MEWSWKSHEFSILEKVGPAVGPPVIARWIRGVDAADAAPTTVVVGASGEVLDRTDPAYEPGTGSLTVLAKGWRDYIALATGFGAVRLGTLDFTLICKSSAGLIPFPVIDEIDFAITEMSDSRAHGSADPAETAVNIQIIKILRNGVQL